MEGGMRKMHDLKIEPKYLDDIRKGNKKFEVRLNDRDYKIGDFLYLYGRELTVSEAVKLFYIDSILVRVNYILEGGKHGIEENYVVMGISVVDGSYQRDYMIEEEE